MPPTHPDRTPNKYAPTRLDNRSRTREQRITTYKASAFGRGGNRLPTHSKPRAFAQADTIHVPGAPSAGQSEHYTFRPKDEAIPKTEQRDPNENVANIPIPTSAGGHALLTTHLIFTLIQ